MSRARVLAAALALSATAASARAAGGDEPDFTVPRGFTVERASERSESYLALAFGPRGELTLSVEDGPILVVRDPDGDGRVDAHEVFSSEVRNAHGLCWHAGSLYAIATRAESRGLFRLTPATGGGEPAVERLLDFPDVGEHGVHGVAAGPDGKLYVMVGNEARVLGAPRAEGPLARIQAGSVLAPLSDPSGFGGAARPPWGTVVRVEADGSFELFCAGLRNAYDLAFDANGELFTCDSDMEWDLGLPWYRPVRVLHLVRDGDYGARSGSNMWPSWYPDTLPVVAELGRGSPTGIAFWRGSGAPEEVRDALLVADWSRGRIEALRLVPEGASWRGERRELMSANVPCPITDLAQGADGALYFVTGGRGVLGDVMRIVRSDAPPAEVAERDPRPAAASELVKACDALAARGDVLALYDRLGDRDPFVRHAARTGLERCLQQGAPGATDALLARLREERDPVRLATAAASLARTPPRGSEATLAPLLFERLAAALADPAHAAQQAALVRAIGLVALALGDPGERERALLAGLLVELLPRAAPETAREIGYLLGRWGLPGAIEALLAALDAAQEQEQALALAWSAVSVEHGWSVPQAASLLAWFDSSVPPDEATSFAGYVESLRTMLIRSLSVDEQLAVARSGTVSARTIALLSTHLGERAPDELVREIERLHAALPDDQAGERERSALVRALAGSAAPQATEWLRELARGTTRSRGAALWALSRRAQREDLELFLAGLTITEKDVADACVFALCEIDARPEDPGTWIRLLDALEPLGRAHGRPLVERMTIWAGRAPLSANEMGLDDWQRAVNTLEQWFKLRFPEAAAQRAPKEGGPRWNAERITAFLERSRARPGSASRGAFVFEKASCASCHAVAGLRGETPVTGAIEISKLGPDLSSAARRFGDVELVETLLYPSRVISDQYRAEILLLDDERHVEGRVVHEDEQTITLLPLGASEPTVLERSEVVERRASTLSPMPEGLLDALTLEETKDLFAFLRADDAERARPGGADWIPLFSGAQRTGWRYEPGLWREQGKVLIGRARGLERASWLVSKSTWSDFELELDVLLVSGNSGLQYRSTVEQEGGMPVGYQADLAPGLWGSLFATDGRGTLAQSDPEVWRGAVDVAGWNHLYVRAVGDRHVIEINGLSTVDLRDEAHASGVLALQLHEGLENELRIANARIRPIE